MLKGYIRPSKAATELTFQLSMSNVYKNDRITYSLFTTNIV